MTIRSLVKRNRHELPVRRSLGTAMAFPRSMDRVFDDFMGGFFDLEPFTALERGLTTEFVPRVNVSETDKEVEVTAELPGMDEKDITVELQNDALRISGERKEEHEEKGKTWRRMEQSYGRFERLVTLPEGIDPDKAKATFKKGVLSVTITKHPEAHETRKIIDIKAA